MQRVLCLRQMSLQEYAGLLVCALVTASCRRLGLLNCVAGGRQQPFCESRLVSQGVVRVIYSSIGREFKKEIMLEHGVNMVVKQHHTRGFTPVRTVLWSRPLRARVVHYVVAQIEGSARESLHESVYTGEHRKKGEKRKKKM